MMQEAVALNRFQKCVEKLIKLVKEMGYIRAVILLVAGVALVVLSFPMNQTKEKAIADYEEETQQEQVKDSEQAYVSELESRLQKVLEDVEGVGKSEVMITLKSSSETVLNKDTSSNSESYVREDGESEESLETKEETVLLEEEGKTAPYVIKKIQPEIEGIVVICEGGDQPYVVQEITSAAEVLFSVSAHKVKVMKKVTT